MSYNWKNDGNLSQKSDMDYVLEVIDSLTAALHQDPNDTEKLFLRGNGYLDARRLDEALEDYSKIIGFGQVEVAWLLRLRNLSAKNTVVVVILKTGKAQKAA